MHAYSQSWRAYFLINVLYLLNHAGKAGTERYVQTLVERLNKNKINAFFAYNEAGLLVERLEALGVDTYRIEMKNRFDLKAARQLAGLCGKIGIELIHTQFLRENYIAMLSRFFNPEGQSRIHKSFYNEKRPGHASYQQTVKPA